VACVMSALDQMWIW